jgi:calcium-dependent protein kinase
VHRQTKLERSVKIYSKALLKEKNVLQSFQKGLEIMRRLDHPNIIKLLEVYEDSNHYFIIEE